MNQQAPQPAMPPQPNNETILRLQIFQKFVQDAASLFLNDMTNESGLTRTKLSEALFWGNQALLNQAQRAAQMAAQQAAQAPKAEPVAPVASPAETPSPANDNGAVLDTAANS